MESGDGQLNWETAPPDARARFARLLLLKEWDRVTRYIAIRLPPSLRAVVDPTDVQQDVMIAAAKRIEQFRPTTDAAVYHWLVAISRNHIAMLLRRHRCQKREGSADRTQKQGESLILLLADVADHGRSPSRSAAAHEAMGRVVAAIDRLPESLRTVIRMRYLESMTPAEVAVSMERSVGAVHQLCTRALRVLRAELRSAALFL